MFWSFKLSFAVNILAFFYLATFWAIFWKIWWIFLLIFWLPCFLYKSLILISIFDVTKFITIIAINWVTLLFNCLGMTFRVWTFPSLFHQFYNTIEYFLVILWPLAMLPYPYYWWSPKLWNSPISRARVTHSTREHRWRESMVGMHFCFRFIDHS